MKKLLKLFGLLLAMGTLFCLSSCDGLFGGGANGADDSNTPETTSSNPINHTFVKEDTVGYNYYYYTSTTRFSYGEHTECYYQISFNVAKKTWIIYTRPVASTTKIEDIASGSYEGDPSKEGKLKLIAADNKSATQTVKVEKNSAGKLCFIGDVAASHQYLGAKDEK
ncbi:MAG: hypothetical protein J5687_03245 [Treponema sp.]|nr:hypothetical protein [Treponema sp.]